MTTKLIRTVLAITFLTTIQNFVSGQGQNIDIRFLKAKFTDTTSGKDLIAVFLVSTRDTASFPPQVMLPPKCTVFENGREKVVLLTENMLGLVLYGADIPQKSKETYNLIKDQVDLKSMQRSMIIEYQIKDVNFDFNTMTLTPAFKEKRNQSIRVEKRCEFVVN
jgi:hypothetical protein